MSPSAHPRYLYAYLAVVVVSVWLALDTIHSNSVVLDEYAHIPAGISYWQLGRFRLYRESPPLVQAIAGLPAFLSGAKVGYEAARGRRGEWSVGWAFLNENAERLQEILCRSRYAILLMGIACGSLIFLWASELYGGAAAVVCATLWLLDPSVLAFSSVVTSDIGSATFGVLAAYTFWLFLRRPGPYRALIAGVVLGLAQGTKFNMLALYPAWLILAVVTYARPWSDVPRIPMRPFVLMLFNIILISLIVLNLLYLFEGSFTPLGAHQFQSRALSGKPTTNAHEPPSNNRFRGTLLADLLIPFPKDYMLGLDSQKWDEEVGLNDLRGGHIVRGGTWYSPLRTLLFKLPPGTLLLILIATIYSPFLANRTRFAGWVPWIPAVALLGLLCSQTGLNWPVRYAISVLPLLTLSAGALLARLLAHRLWRWAVLAALCWNVTETFQVAPHFLSYGNVLAGGTAGAQRMFLGSNYDWGQDLYRLRRWYDQNLSMRPLSVTYFGAGPSDLIGIPMGTLTASFFEANREEQRGIAIGTAPDFYWAISSNFLNGMSESFRLDNGESVPARIRSPLLKPENAVARVGATIFIFRIGPCTVKPSDMRTIGPEALKGCLVEFRDEGFGLDTTP
jgi:energy-coupling factor transporter transmembrane protein EcfT